jgi:hypothetical protein
MNAPRTVARPERVVRKRARGREEVVERSWIELASEAWERREGGDCAGIDMASVWREGGMEKGIGEWVSGFTAQTNVGGRGLRGGGQARGRRQRSNPA